MTETRYYEVGDHVFSISGAEGYANYEPFGCDGGDIFLLDEISSSLDEQTEKELYTRLFAAYPQQAMLLITHRSSVCALCEETLRLGITK